MTMRSVALSALVVLSSACGSSSKGSSGGGPAGPPLYDDFSSGSISGARWNQGQYRAELSGQAALLSQAITGALANTTYGTNLVLVPPAGGEVTTLQADAVIDASSSTGDTAVRTGIDLVFQPLANRIQGPGNLTNALLARVVLTRGSSGLLALRQLLECTAPDCSTSQGVGTATGAANWPSAGLAIAEGTSYTLSVSVDASTKIFTFSIQGGAYSTAKTQTIDASGVTSPFAVDVSATNFFEARLLAAARGGATGGGDGAITAHLDNVLVGVDGGAASPFDDFNTGTTFDPARWKVGRESAQLVGGPAVQFVLDQSDAPGGAQLNLASSGLSVLQADAKVSLLSLTGQGRVGARIAGAIYNDGTNGSGTAPDVNEASSQVGDVIAGVSLTDTDASWFVIRCDTATCDPDPSSTLGLTFVKPFTSLGPVTLGTTHTLNMQWNAATHLLSFQLDGGAAVSFDPTPGYPVAGAPNRPFRQIGVRAGAAGPTAPFAAGSSASATAAFSNVRGQ